MGERLYAIRDGKEVEKWIGCLYAFNHEGKLRWKYIAPSYIGGNPTVKNGIIYFVSGDKNLYAVDGNEGVLLWKYTMEQTSYSSPAIANDIVYVGGQDHFFYAIDAKDGHLRWKYKTGYAVNSSPSVYKGIVYFGSFDRYFYALDANNGKVKWKFRFDAEEKIHDCPAIRENTVFFSSDQGTLYALDAQTGKLRWKQKIDSRGLLSSPVVTDNLVFVGTSDGFVYGLDIEAGNLMWNYGTGGATSSAALYKGRIVVVSGYGYIYMFSDQSKSPKVIAPCTIKGKVIDSEDRPIINATVTIGKITTFADKDGNYGISVPVEGDILIRAHAEAKDGYYEGSAVVEVTEGKIFIKNIVTSFIEASHR
jgi:outer membrane protein assembly factor BamB